MQLNVGPTTLPWAGFSDTPPDHKSMSNGDLTRAHIIVLIEIRKRFVVDFFFFTNSYIVWYRCMVELDMNPAISSNLLATANPQWRLNSMYPGSPKSLPRCMLNDTKSKPYPLPGFLIRLWVTSCVIESSMAWATWFMRPIKYSSIAPALYKSNGRRIKSDSFLEAEKRQWRKYCIRRPEQTRRVRVNFTIVILIIRTDKTVRFTPAFNGVRQ